MNIWRETLMKKRTNMITRIEMKSSRSTPPIQEPREPDREIKR